MKRFGALFAAAPEVLPASYADLERYFQWMGSTVLVAGPAARKLAAHILTPQAWGARPPLSALPALLAAGLLPPGLREEYGLAWGRRERRSYEVLRLATRAGLPVLPPALRYWPHYRSALRRLDG